MRVCLVRTPAPFLINEYAFPPLGLMAVGTALKEQGHTVHLHDGPLDATPLDSDWYGMGPTTPEYPAALLVKDTVRHFNRHARIIIGGPHATLNPDMCVRDGFDGVVIGDGEIAAQEAFLGIATVIHAASLPLDTYPTIDRSLIDQTKYTYLLDGRRATSMITSQGCPFKCAFCSKNYGTVRFRSVERIADEIHSLAVRWGYRALLFPEDLFIMRQDRCTDICHTLKDHDLIWRCLVRGDLIVKYGPVFTNMLARTGCVEVGIGVESGSNTILQNVRKGEKAETILQAIHMLKDCGIRVKGFFILGLPGETRETIAETRAFLEAAQLDDVDIKIYQPLPGSPIWANRAQYDITWQDPQDLSGTFFKGRAGEYHGSLATAALSTQDIYDAWVDLESTYKNWQKEEAHVHPVDADCALSQ